MEYPPNFKGFLKAVVDTIFKHHPKKKHPGKDSPGKEHYWSIKGYEIYEPDKDPGMEFWRAEAEKFVERKEQEKVEAEKQMIEDYESRHAEEASTETAEISSEADEVVTEGIDGSDSGLEAEETDDSSGTDDFHADIGIEIDEDS